MCKASQIQFDEEQIIEMEKFLEEIPGRGALQVSITQNNTVIRSLIEIIGDISRKIKNEMIYKVKRHIKMEPFEIKIFQTCSGIIEKQSLIIKKEIRKLDKICFFKPERSIPLSESLIIAGNAMEKYIQEQEYVINLLLNEMFYCETMLIVVKGT